MLASSHQQLSSTNNMYPHNFSNQHQVHDFYDSETDDKKDKSGISKRQRQMIKAYMPSDSIAVADNGPLAGPSQASAPQHARKKSNSSAHWTQS